MYYYAVVTNTNLAVNGAKTASAVSNTARINVTSDSIVNADTPLITAQPASASYIVSVTAATLTVTASVNDGGTLSYQWFRNTTNTNSGGTPIADATTAGYTPPTTTLGTVYYYVVVTNTNTGVNGAQTASAASEAAAITAAAGVIDPATAAARTQLQSAINQATAAKNAVGTTWVEGAEYPPIPGATGAGFTVTPAADLPLGLFYVPSSFITTLENAIAAAQAVCNNQGATAGELEAATDALAALIFTTAENVEPGTLTLAARIAAAASGKILYLYAGETFPGVTAANITKSLTLKGSGEERIVRLTGTGNMFYLNAAGNLTLDDNVTLLGVDDNTASLVYVESGTLLMKGAARVTGNTAGSLPEGQNPGVFVSGGGVYVTGTSGFPGAFTMRDSAVVSDNTAGLVGGGVFVDEYGIFTMEGGSVGGNTALSGGGVRNQDGTFTMEGGEVRGNTALTNGGGVSVVANSTGTFTMRGSAVVIGNTALSGGGVEADGLFIMEGSASVSGNTALSGGGVALYPGGTLIKESGTIYGDTDLDHSPNSTENTADTGNGHAVYIIDTGSNAKVRNSDANTSVKLYAKWENGSWTYDGSGVAGIGEDTESEWLAPPPPGPPPSP